ncbi:DNA polymerase III subunit gamma/tau [Amedibacterium intestinale]|uniref:DNA-directed DNA polymerase n=1 Tax=Amedibacterium intestinale TaxID=2583452 RepID=A0A6N4TL70_9FIRM|nr:DNA polymerase III subunit gamma/tau [Amedibacterium intestinale]BBK23244.1 DNA polymerase III subunit gamma/tau [Amedibacterium intestinale]
MAYKALYRTYRPSSFEEVAGQQHIVQTLKHAIEQNKIAHAYLFCGPRGTGKTSIAKIFAKTINCTSEGHRPCQQCENCLEVQNGSHPDIVEIDAASNNGVEEVRNLIEKVKYAPLKGKYKVYIIDEVHMMSTGAFNALLKTIEEPPAHVIFILATTEPHKVLPTIISRCQRFDFTKVPSKEIEHRIHTILNAENITCEEEVIRIISQLADGGLRDALSILDQCIAYAQNNIEVHHINEIYGITTVSEKIQMLNDIIDQNAVSLMDKVESIIEKGIDIKRLTVDLIELLKESILFEYTKDSSLLKILGSTEAQHLVEKTTLQKRFSMIHLLMEAYDKYRNAANVPSYFEVCMLQMLDVASLKEENNIHIAEENKQSNVKPNVSRETLVKEKPSLILADEEEDDEYIGNIEEEKEEISEENIQKEEIKQYEKSIKPLDNEFLLSLLAGANKPEKAKDIEKFNNLDFYMMDLNYAKYANLLKHCLIVASGNNYIVLCTDNQPEANEINEADQQDKFGELMVKLLEKNKKVFAIAKEQQKIVIQLFKDRMIAGTLPQPAYIEPKMIEKKVEKQMSEEEKVLDLFGEENIIVTEE